MKVADLKPNARNPRKITDKRLSQLSKAVEEFGDLSGIVFNRKTKELVSGHQRLKLFEKDTEITIDVAHKKPTKNGTVAEGFIVLRGERFPYREVSWDETRQKAATIAANNSAGSWDNNILGDWLLDIDDMGMDLDLTMFDELERKKFQKKEKIAVSAHERDGSKELNKEEFDNFEHLCPRCGFEFDKSKAAK